MLPELTEVVFFSKELVESGEKRQNLITRLTRVRGAYAVSTVGGLPPEHVLLWVNRPFMQPHKTKYFYVNLW